MWKEREKKRRRGARERVDGCLLSEGGEGVPVVRDSEWSGKRRQLDGRANEREGWNNIAS